MEFRVTRHNMDLNGNGVIEDGEFIEIVEMIDNGQVQQRYIERDGFEGQTGNDVSLPLDRMMTDQELLAAMDTERMRYPHVAFQENFTPSPELAAQLAGQPFMTAAGTVDLNRIDADALLALPEATRILFFQELANATIPFTIWNPSSVNTTSSSGTSPLCALAAELFNSSGSATLLAEMMLASPSVFNERDFMSQWFTERAIDQALDHMEQLIRRNSPPDPREVNLWIGYVERSGLIDPERIAVGMDLLLDTEPAGRLESGDVQTLTAWTARYFAGAGLTAGGDVGAIMESLLAAMSAQFGDEAYDPHRMAEIYAVALGGAIQAFDPPPAPADETNGGLWFNTAAWALGGLVNMSTKNPWMLAASAILTPLISNIPFFTEDNNLDELRRAANAWVGDAFSMMSAGEPNEAWYTENLGWSAEDYRMFQDHFFEVMLQAGLGLR